MFATVSSWQFHESLRDPAARFEFMQSLVSRGITPARDAGALDALLVTIEPDRMIAITIYESLDDIEAAVSNTKPVIATHFSDQISLRTRETGPVYESNQMFAQEEAEPPARRAESDGMGAYVARWTIDPALDSTEVEDWVRTTWNDNQDFLHELGLLDRMVIRVTDDQLLVVNLFPEGLDGATIYHEAIARRPNMIYRKVALISGETGRAFDIPALIGDLGDRTVR
jgi:hypothetical protein